MDEHTDHGNVEVLYTLISYEGNDELIEIGRGAFTPEMFTRKDIPQYAWLLHSPLKLFVTDAWARKEDTSDPEEFLQRHAVIYSPKWGQAEIRQKHTKKAINHW
jgi:hypothetical protein